MEEISPGLENVYIKYTELTLFGLSRISGILAHITEYVETQERLIRPRESDLSGRLFNMSFR